MVQEEIDRALLRGGITDPADVRLRLEDSQLPNEVDVLSLIHISTLRVLWRYDPFLQNIPVSCLLFQLSSHCAPCADIL